MRDTAERFGWALVAPTLAVMVIILALRTSPSQEKRPNPNIWLMAP